jgi:hypothetical protein
MYMFFFVWMGRQLFHSGHLDWMLLWPKQQLNHLKGHKQKVNYISDIVL